MEGLIPFVYRAIMEHKYKRGGNRSLLLGSLLNDSPSASYIRLPDADSGRFQTNSEFQLFKSDYGFSSSSPQPYNSTPSSTNSQIRGSSSGVHAPFRRSRRVAT